MRRVASVAPPSRSATFDVSRPSRSDQLPQVRPSTADRPQLPHTLPRLGEVVDDIDIVDEDLKLYLAQPHLSEPPPAIPTIVLDGTSTSGSISSQCPTHIPAPAHPDSDIALSEGCSGTSSNKFEPYTPGLRADATNNDDLIVKCGLDGLVKTGTLPGLVERLILGSGDFGTDQDYKETFLTSYRAFTTADEVLRLLLERFEAVSSPSHTTEQRASVRYSVIAVLELWLDKNYIEAKDAPLLQRMRGFAASLQASSSVSAYFREAAQKLIQLIDKQLDVFLSPIPPLTPSSSSSSLKKPGISSDITPQVLANVLTSIEGDRYRKLMEADLVDWLEEIYDTNGVSSFIAENKKLGHWAQKTILRPHDQDERAANLKYFLLVIKECRRLRNFSTACALMNGLATASITDLKRTYGELDKPEKSVFQEARKLISTDKNFKAYRGALDESKDACVPWLYVHLHDLKLMHRAQQIFVEEDGRTDLINFERCRRVHRRIRKVLDYHIPRIEPVNRPHYAGMVTLVEAQLSTLVVDDGLCDWLQKTGMKLAREELADYNGRGRELQNAGFIRPSTHASYIPHKRTSSTTRSLGNAQSPTLHTPRSESTIETPPAMFPGPREEVVKSVFSLEVFDKNSERCLDGRITRLSIHPVASGGYADVWEGLIDHQKVAIKTLRPFSSEGRRMEEKKLLKRIWREYSAWTWVSHPIVLECLGFTYDFSPEPYDLPSLISPWMSNGTLTMYLEKNRDTDRLKILLDVAEGLSFLHDQHPPIIHGDLRGGNILMSDSGRPCLSDFGLSRVLKLEGMTTTSELAGSLRWMSPELLRDDVVASVSSDVWAYAMTILEIMSGRVPYHDVVNAPYLLNVISQGQIPSRPQEMRFPAVLTDEVWAICQKCWNIIPRQRPLMRDVFSEIGYLIQ